MNVIIDEWFTIAPFVKLHFNSRGIFEGNPQLRVIYNFGEHRYCNLPKNWFLT